ncbi:MAG: hypothetical protein V1835_00510 [Candidatus Micrarchaeota archaeon]
MSKLAAFAVLLMLAASVSSLETFSLKVEIPDNYKESTAGDTLWATTTIFNMGSSKRMDITLRFDILDSNKVSRSSKSKTIAIETQVSTVESMQLPSDLPEGKYALAVTLVSPEKSYVGEDSFEIVPKKIDTAGDGFLFFALPLFAGLILVAIGVVFGIPRMRAYFEKRGMRSKVRQIVQARIKPKN